MLPELADTVSVPGRSLSTHGQANFVRGFPSLEISSSTIACEGMLCLTTAFSGSFHSKSREAVIHKIPKLSWELNSWSAAATAVALRSWPSARLFQESVPLAVTATTRSPGFASTSRCNFLQRFQRLDFFPAARLSLRRELLSYTHHARQEISLFCEFHQAASGKRRCARRRPLPARCLQCAAFPAPLQNIHSHRATPCQNADRVCQSA